MFFFSKLLEKMIKRIIHLIQSLVLINDSLEKKTCHVTLLFCSSRVKCSKQLLLRKMACRTGLSEHRNMSLIVSEKYGDKEWKKTEAKIR